jgi:two-component system phosphate regulon sensor histidine kinase PhoR
MVNDLSTLSRAERGVADTPEPINVRELLESLYNEYAPQAQKKKLHFNLDTTGRLGTVTTSRLYLHELLQNFITNSIKYTKTGSITLHAERTGKNIVFEVRDTGIGISKSDQAKIFDKFYRSEDYRTRETGGTGLGLYVAAKLARKLNTSIEVKSRLNHGSTFSITLPVET